MARVLAMIVWVAVGATAVFWGSHFVPSAHAPPARAAAAMPAPPLREDVTRLLGVEAPSNRVEATPAFADSSRFQLIGVIASPDAISDSQGVALIVIDGQPARAFRVGAMLTSDRVLQSVQMRGAWIGSRDDGISFLLSLPANRQAGVQTRPSNPVPTVHSPVPGNVRLQDSAPNTQMNNPADMARPETGGSEERGAR